MNLTHPRTAAEADLCLRAAVAGLRRARAYPGNARIVYIAAALARVDRFLDLWLEFTRQEAEHRVEETWCLSWPGSAPPQWPQSEWPQSEGMGA